MKSNLNVAINEEVYEHLMFCSYVVEEVRASLVALDEDVITKDEFIERCKEAMESEAE